MDYQNAYHLLNELPSKYRPDMTNGVVYEGDEFLTRLSARDPEKQTVQYLLTGGALPAGAFLDPAQGTITGTLTLKHFDSDETLAGDHTWYFTVGGFDGVKIKNQDFAITVKHINQPVQWDPAVGGAVLEMFEGQSIAQATVFTGSQLLGSTGNVVVRANAVPISAPVNFNTTLAQTARDVANSINSNVSTPDYTATYISGSTFKVSNAAGYGVAVTAHSSGNMVINPVNGSASVQLVDADGNPTSDVSSALGWKVLGAVDPEADYDPAQATPVIFTANGRLFDRNDANAVPDCTITMLTNGIMTGALPEINGNSGQVVGKFGAAFPFAINAFDGQYNAARDFAILVKNTNQPPVWNAVPAEGAEIGPVVEGSPMSAYTFHAYDPDGDTLTWGIDNFTVNIGGNEVATTLSNVGLSFNTSTGTLSGTPSNDAVPPDENISNTVWYLANPNGATAAPADGSYYAYDSASGVNVFQSKPNESIFVTTAADANVSPALGERYRITYSIRMLQAPTNGIKGYVRPAFDGFNGPIPVVLGQRSGFGYVSNINDVGYDFFDTSLWTVGQWYAITVDYTVNQSFAALRGRIRMNRAAYNAGGPPYWNGSGYINRADGPPYSNAIYQIRGYSLTKHQAEVYKFNTSVTDGQYTINRTHKLTVGNQNLPPVWDSPTNLGTYNGNTYVSVQVAAHDPEGNAVSYTHTGGTIPTGTLFNNGLISGVVANASNVFNFTITASDGTLTTPQSFTMTITAAANGPPVWSSPPNGATILIGEAGSTIVSPVQLIATDPEGSTVTFFSADKPGTISITNSTPTTGFVGGTIPSPAGLYPFTVQAMANGDSTPRSFVIESTVSLPPPVLTTLDFTTPGTYVDVYTVPNSSPAVTSVNFNKILGAGGGGGTGTQVGSGGGGGGGGSGGEITNQAIPVNIGDRFDVVVGAGGPAGLDMGNVPPWAQNGTAGGDTAIIHKNSAGTVLATYTATGGQGGAGCVNTAHGLITSPGGAGGAPGGSAGGTGPAGGSDYASSAGADGASSSMGTGGQGGSIGAGHIDGNPGTGYGAGGGGGGSYDRIKPTKYSWSGGAGSGGRATLTPQV